MGNPACPGNAVDVDVEDRQENADAQRPSPGKKGVGHLLDVRHQPVRGADQRGRIAGDQAFRIAKERENEHPEDRDQGEGRVPEGMDQQAQDHQAGAGQQEKGAETDDLGQPGPCQAKPAAPGKAVVLGPEPVAADVAAEFQVAGIDDVIRPRAASLAQSGHVLDVPREKETQPGTPAAAPEQFQPQA